MTRTEHENTAQNGTFDDLIIGAGMGGLTVGALLASAGRRVLMVEAHDTPGGYAHTFTTGKYRFCAQVHYIFGCGEGEPVHELLRRTGLLNEVEFHRLDPEGFDHIVVGAERYRIPNGLEKLRDRMIHRFPSDERPIRGYIDAVMAIGRELDAMPSRIGVAELLTAPLKFPNLLRYRSWTLARLYDKLHMPPRLRTIFAGQAGDYLLPPGEVSLLLHVALVRAYDRGAFYPKKHYAHMIERIASVIANGRGCRLMLENEVREILIEGGRVAGVRTRSGAVLRASRYISNLDPRLTASLLPKTALPTDYQKKLDYDYSSGTVTLYLGLRGLDLRDHGFGSHNVWHYPDDDMDGTYRRQLVARDFSAPWLFMSTPTLHTDEPGLCPPGDQILEVATSAPYTYFKDLRDRDRAGYNREKKALREQLVSVIEAALVPNLSKHIVHRVMGTPATNARFCGAPDGNSYGSALTPKNVNGARVPYETPIPNLFQVNATAGFPSIGGTVKSGIELYEKLAPR
jgi:phytoene dehydrogenase-like protein